jgi:heme-degrading monooxygenase HmoA
MQSAIETPQTATTMEACMRLADGPQQEAFWKAQERMGPVVAAQPGFRAVIGGPIARSTWMYFCGKFDSPANIDAWHQSKLHRPVIDKAYSEWFDAFYIRKWRDPADGEALHGPLFLETSIIPDDELEHAVVESLLDDITADLVARNAPAFETLPGRFEPQPFQFVGPLEEFPAVAPHRYLLLTHWDDETELRAWLDSDISRRVEGLGKVEHNIQVLIRHAPGEREHLNEDGSLRGWERSSGVPA